MINKGKVINLKKIGNVNFFAKNKYLIAVSLLYLCGVILSILLYSKKGSAVNWQGVFKEFYLTRNSAGFFNSYLKSLLFFISVLSLIFTAGTSVIGVGIIPAVILVTGCFMGGLTAYLYVTYSLKGIAFNALIVLPVAVIFIIVLFFGARSAFEYSVYLSKLAVKRHSAGNGALSFRAYSRVFLILAVALTILSFVDTLLSKMFLRLFSF